MGRLWAAIRSMVMHPVVSFVGNVGVIVSAGLFVSGLVAGVVAAVLTFPTYATVLTTVGAGGLAVGVTARGLQALETRAREARRGAISELRRVLRALLSELTTMRRDIDVARSGPMLPQEFQLRGTRWNHYADLLGADSELYDALEAAYIEADQLNKAHGRMFTTGVPPLVQVLGSEFDRTAGAIDRAQEIVAARIERYRGSKQ